MKKTAKILCRFSFIFVSLQANNTFFYFKPNSDE